MCVASFGAAMVGGEPELPDTIGNGSVGDFANKVFVAHAPGLGGNCKKNVFFLWCGL